MSSPEEQPHDPLDALLRGVAWPEPGPEISSRLRQHWLELSPARTRPLRKRFRPLIAMAAALACLTAGGLLWYATSPHREPQLAAPLPPGAPGPAPAERPQPQPASDALIEQPAVAPELAAVREPNSYELMLFRAEQRRKALVRQQQLDRLVSEAIGQLLGNSATDVRTAAAPLIQQRASAEPRLATMAQHSRGQEQLAAIRLLGIVGTHRSIPILLDLSQRAALHDAAVRSLAALADPLVLGRLAAAEQDPLLRQLLLATLLARGDEQSVAVFLRFVEEEPSDPVALAMAAEASPVPLQVLFAFLHGPHSSRRMAAARVLGRIDDPRIPQRLIPMVQQNVYRQEALVALLCSPRREAAEFLESASRDPLLLASVQAAHYRFANLP